MLLTRLHDLAVAGSKQNGQWTPQPGSGERSCKLVLGRARPALSMTLRSQRFQRPELSRRHDFLRPGPLRTGIHGAHGNGWLLGDAHRRANDHDRGDNSRPSAPDISMIVPWRENPRDMGRPKYASRPGELDRWKSGGAIAPPGFQPRRPVAGLPADSRLATRISEVMRQPHVSPSLRRLRECRIMETERERS